MANFATGILRGVPYGQETTQTGGGQSVAGQVAGLGMAGAGIAGLAMSERRLKRDIKALGRKLAGAPLYFFRYIWSPDWHIGAMADEVERIHPEAVVPINGIQHVDYGLLAELESAR
jgi:hypothetical protein